jgi:hypothetical protein
VGKQQGGGGTNNEGTSFLLGINSYLTKLVKYFKNCVLTVQITVLLPS